MRIATAKTFNKTRDYLCFTANEDNSTIQLNKIGSPTKVSLEYSFDYLHWTAYTFGDTITLENEGDKVYRRNKSKTTTRFSLAGDKYYKFTMTGSISGSGDVNFLINKNSSTNVSDLCFLSLFEGCTSLIEAPKVPATVLSNFCYVGMFSGCTNLVSAPELPATTMKLNCYSGMFNGCTSLTEAPELPATKLNNNCYMGMFEGCTSLIEAPELPATWLGGNCYGSMFKNCTSLTQAPELPAMTLDNSCYANMFYGCTSLETPPELPATTLADSCYQTMFQYCTSLKTIPELPATTLKNYCYDRMFSGCIEIKLSDSFNLNYHKKYKIPSEGVGTTATDALRMMFNGTGGTVTDIVNINTVYYLRDDEPIKWLSFSADENSTIRLIKNGAPTEVSLEISRDWETWTPYTIGDTITLNEGEMISIRNTSEVDTGFNLGFYNFYYFAMSGKISAGGNITSLLNKNGTDTLNNYCFGRLFHSCSSLTVAPLLPVTTLADNCYSYMFSGCRGLTKAPELPATTLAYYCYEMMFNQCISLTQAPELPATTLAWGCYNGMFYGCTALTSVPELPATTLTQSCYSGMFKGCTSIKLSSVKCSKYQKSYRIPSDGTGVTGSYSLNNMFQDTGGEFTGTPDINTTYYLWQENYVPALKVTLKGNNCRLGIIKNGNWQSDVSLEYSRGSKLHWQPYTMGTMIENIVSGEYFYFRNTSETDTGFSYYSDQYYQFVLEGNEGVEIDGEIDALLNKNGTYNTSDWCYLKLFKDCRDITDVKQLTIATTSYRCCNNMFVGCTGLTKLPELPAITLADSCYATMFEGCTGIKLSNTKIGKYHAPYRIPSEGTGTAANNSLSYMFYGTGGTFAGTPEVNTVYYEWDENYVEVLNFEANTAGSTVQLVKHGNPTEVSLEISADEETWTPYTIGDTITLTNIGDKVYRRNTSETDTQFNSLNYYYHFTMTGSIAAGGNVTSLLNKNLTNTLSGWCFINLFDGCTALTKAPKLEAVNLGQACYYNMFKGCTNLIDAPILPATVLSGNCYARMFHGCTSLISTPELPAATLTPFCYSHMFDGCISLTEAPELPATTLSNDCCTRMFAGCVGLIQAPELPATTLAHTCYGYMFEGCTSLKTIPELPATTLADKCYMGMFSGCTGLKISTTQNGKYQISYRIPSDGVGIDASMSTSDMFVGTGGTFTGNPSINTTYYVRDYNYIAELNFAATENNTYIILSKTGSPTSVSLETSIDGGETWTPYTIGASVALSNIGDKVIFRNTSDVDTGFSTGERDYYYFSAFSGGVQTLVHVNGDVTYLLNKNGTSTLSNRCFTGLFGGFMMDTTPKLTATTLAEGCYYGMFSGSGIIEAPELPAITLNSYCYANMFSGCVNLTEAPELPATTLANSCYSDMFSNCTSLVNSPSIPATTMGNSSCYNMFFGCTSLETIPALYATNWGAYCYESMFEGCTNIKLSETRTGEYQTPYRIPMAQYGSGASNGLYNMFTDTGGTFTGEPNINTTYYTSNTVV